jgi:murein DD-endopeptidase MepM/ murein hydrolase activator NlpD
VSRFLSCVALLGALIVGPAELAHAATYRPPVDAPVVDGFRLPDGPYGAGNRGLQYATSPGDPVHAIGDGLVVFAGPVGGTRAVTVVHPDGLRSSYSYLAEVRVDVGQPVARGTTIGLAGETFHLGVRAGGTYLDPAALFVTTGVHLVPVEPPTRKAKPEPGPVQRAWGWLTGTVTLARRS